METVEVLQEVKCDEKDEEEVLVAPEPIPVTFMPEPYSEATCLELDPGKEAAYEQTATCLEPDHGNKAAYEPTATSLNDHSWSTSNGTNVNVSIPFEPHIQLLPGNVSRHIQVQPCGSMTQRSVLQPNIPQTYITKVGESRHSPNTSTCSNTYSRKSDIPLHMKPKLCNNMSPDLNADARRLKHKAVMVDLATKSNFIHADFIQRQPGRIFIKSNSVPVNVIELNSSKDISELNGKGEDRTLQSQSIPSINTLPLRLKADEWHENGFKLTPQSVTALNNLLNQPVSSQTEADFFTYLKSNVLNASFKKAGSIVIVLPCAKHAKGKASFYGNRAIYPVTLSEATSVQNEATVIEATCSKNEAAANVPNKATWRQNKATWSQNEATSGDIRATYNLQNKATVDNSNVEFSLLDAMNEDASTEMIEQDGATSVKPLLAEVKTEIEATFVKPPLAEVKTEIEATCLKPPLAEVKTEIEAIFVKSLLAEVKTEMGATQTLQSITQLDICELNEIKTEKTFDGWSVNEEVKSELDDSDMDEDSGDVSSFESDTERPYVCSFSSCEKSYSRSQHLTRHIKVSHSEEKGSATLVRCIQCEQKFSSIYSLRKHEKQIHGDEKYYKNKCSIEGCAEMFRTSHQLKAHLFAHKGVNLNQCHIEGCQRQFSQNSHLKRHLNRHESGYVCYEAGCNLSLPEMSSLRKHKANRHRRTFQCNDCDKWFYRKSVLQSHVRKHNEINDKIKCSLCDRSYFDRRNLTAHIQHSHSGVRFPCDMCGQLYVTKQKMQSHYRQCGQSLARKAKPYDLYLKKLQEIEPEYGSSKEVYSSNNELSDITDLTQEEEESQSAPTDPSASPPPRHLDKHADAKWEITTSYSTKWAARLVKDWLLECGYNPEFEELEAPELALLLCSFYGEVNSKENGTYSSSSLHGIRAGINRHLQNPPHNRGINITSDKAFIQANQVFEGRMKRSREKGYDVNTQKSRIAPEDIDMMYTSEVLSNKSPQALQYKVFLELALQFGRWGRKGLHSLRKDSFILMKDDADVEYVKLSDDENSKKKQNFDAKRRKVDVRMYSKPDDANCPVKSLKLYLSKLNPQSDSFFQKPRTHAGVSHSQTWFSSLPVGVNTLASFMKEISIKAGLSKIYTNHCIRLTATASPVTTTSIPVLSNTNSKENDKQAPAPPIDPPTPQDTRQPTLPQHDLDNEAPAALIDPPSPQDTRQFTFPQHHPDKLADPKSTSQSTKWAVRLLKDWLFERGYNPDFENLEASELDLLLCSFYGEVNSKENGTYSRSTLGGIRAGINRHLQNPPHNWVMNIVSDKEFMSSNQIFTERMKISRKKGHDVTTHRSRIAPEDIDMMYTSEVLSNKSPQALQYKVFFELSQRFGGLGRKGLHGLRKDSFMLVKDDADGNVQYVTMLADNEQTGKNLNPDANPREVPDRMYSKPDPNCPVKTFNLYLSKLHPESDSFYQKPRSHAGVLNSQTWYSSFPVGVNTLASFMKQISIKAGLSKIYTNSSVQCKH